MRTLQVLTAVSTPSSHNQPGGPERQQKHIKHSTYRVVQASYKLLRKSKQTDRPVFTFCEVIILSLGNFNKNTNCQHFVLKVKLMTCLWIMTDPMNQRRRRIQYRSAVSLRLSLHYVSDLRAWLIKYQCKDEDWTYWTPGGCWEGKILLE